MLYYVNTYTSIFNEAGMHSLLPVSKFNMRQVEPTETGSSKENYEKDSQNQIHI